MSEGRGERVPALILGGAGFLGSHLARRLLERAHAVTIFDRPRISDQRVHTLPDVRRVEGDFQNEADLRPLLESHPLVFHFIGSTLPCSSNENPSYDVETNVVDTLRLLDMAVAAGVRRIVFPSSGGTVYGPSPEVPRREDDPTHPISSYGITKLVVEKYLELYRRLFGLDYLCFRFSNPYGEDQTSTGVLGAVSTFIQRAKNGQPVEIWGDGSTTRDYILVDDAIDAILCGLEYRGDFRLFNVGTGVGTSLNELVTAIRSISGQELEVRCCAGRRADVPWNVLDVSRARTELGWRPATTLEAGIARLWNALDG